MKIFFHYVFIIQCTFVHLSICRQSICLQENVPQRLKTSSSVVHFNLISEFE